MIRSLLAIVAIAFAVAACDQAPQAASPAPPPAPLPMKYWMVFFDTNSATLNDKAASTVAEAAGIAKAMANSTVTVTGFTDTDGSPAYNMALSLRRAQAVKAALVASGVSSGAITISGKGEEGLLVATPDQTVSAARVRAKRAVRPLHAAGVRARCMALGTHRTLGPARCFSDGSRPRPSSSIAPRSPVDASIGAGSASTTARARWPPTPPAASVRQGNRRSRRRLREHVEPMAPRRDGSCRRSEPPCHRVSGAAPLRTSPPMRPARASRTAKPVGDRGKDAPWARAPAATL